MRKEYDFSKAKRAKDVPHLAKLQAEAKGKTRITIMLDNVVIEAFKDMAKKKGIGYQTLINQALLENVATKPLDEETLRSVIREELGRYAISERPDPD
jgi:predicted DNA binding CopG/RHH family protein